VLQHRDEDGRNAQICSDAWLALITNEQHPIEMQQAVLQRLLQHLPGLLLTACRKHGMRMFVDQAALAAVVAAHAAEQGSLQPQQLQPVLQSLVHSVDAGTASAARSVIRQLMLDAQVRVQLCEQAATQLPALLGVMDRSWATWTAILDITAAAYYSAALQQALQEHAGEVLAALQQQLAEMMEAPRTNGADPWRLVLPEIKHSLLWLLWDSHSVQAIARAGIERDMGAALLLPPGCTLWILWPPHNVQLLQHPALLDCMLMLATRVDSAAFAMQFVSRIVAASEEAAVLLSPQRMQLVAAAVEALATGAEQLRQQQRPGEAGSFRLCTVYKSLVQLLQCMFPLSASRQGLLALEPHAQVLQTAAACAVSRGAAMDAA
jgi:hypothetical protein